MKKIIWVMIVLLLTTVLSACFALEEPEASSGTAVAPAIPADPPTDQPIVEPTAEPVVEPTSVPVEETIEETATTVPEEEPTVPPTEIPIEETAVPSTAEPVEEMVYEIDASRSEARFNIEEVLRGADTTVVGVSSNLAGQIIFDLANPAATQMGEILINARDFATDNDFRNRAIANEILLTNDFEFISFMPKELTGLPETAVVGEAYDFQILGDLTIIGETREVTFDVTVTPLSTTELQGLASVVVLYEDFGVTVPLSQFVTAVNEDVLLELDFVAVAQ